MEKTEDRRQETEDRRQNGEWEIWARGRSYQLPVNSEQLTVESKE